MDEIVRRWTVFGIKIKFSWRSPRSLMGRFGGGWNWKIGVQAGGGRRDDPAFVTGCRAGH